MAAADAMGEAREKPKLDAAIVRQTLAGFAEVNRLSAAERRARLWDMSDADARRIFDDLVATHEWFQGDGPGWERLSRARIEQKLSLRLAFKRLARSRGLA